MSSAIQAAALPQHPIPELSGNALMNIGLDLGNTFSLATQDGSPWVASWGIEGTTFVATQLALSLNWHHSLLTTDQQLRITQFEAGLHYPTEIFGFYDGIKLGWRGGIAWITDPTQTRLSLCGGPVLSYDMPIGNGFTLGARGSYHLILRTPWMHQSRLEASLAYWF